MITEFRAVRKIVYIFSVEAESAKDAKRLVSAMLKEEKTGDGCTMRDVYLYPGSLESDCVVSAKLISTS